MGYILIQEKDFQRARNKIREAKKQKPDKIVVFTSKDDELNRKILEKEKIDILLLQLAGRKDKIRQRDSGFNQVMAKTAKKAGVSIGINLDEILNSKEEEKSEILSRIRQNIKLCNKNKLKMAFISEFGKIRNRYDLKALGLVLGMPTWMTKSIE